MRCLWFKKKQKNANFKNSIKISLNSGIGLKTESFLPIKKLKKGSQFAHVFLIKKNAGLLLALAAGFLSFTLRIVSKVSDFQLWIKNYLFLTLAISKQSCNYIRTNWGSKSLAQMHGGFVKQRDCS